MEVCLDCAGSDGVKMVVRHDYNGQSNQEWILTEKNGEHFNELGYQIKSKLNNKCIFVNNYRENINETRDAIELSECETKNSQIWIPTVYNQLKVPDFSPSKGGNGQRIYKNKCLQINPNDNHKIYAAPCQTNDIYQLWNITLIPTNSITPNPTKNTINPTILPTNIPTITPTIIPTTNSTVISVSPSQYPSSVPTSTPTNDPTLHTYNSTSINDERDINILFPKQNKMVIFIATISIVILILILAIIYMVYKQNTILKEKLQLYGSSPSGTAKNSDLKTDIIIQNHVQIIHNGHEPKMTSSTIIIPNDWNLNESDMKDIPQHKSISESGEEGIVPNNPDNKQEFNEGPPNTSNNNKCKKNIKSLNTATKHV